MLRKWLLRPVLDKINILGRIIMSTLDDLQAVATRISVDIDTALASKDAQIGALTAQAATDATTIASLQAQLSAFQNDAVVIDTVVSVLEAADAKLAPPAAPAP